MKYGLKTREKIVLFLSLFDMSAFYMPDTCLGIGR